MRYLYLYAAVAAVLASACREKARFPAASQLRVTDAVAVQLQAEPGTKGVVLRALRAGEIVRDLDESSDFMSAITAGKTILQGPWVRVEASDGKIGWVFGAALTPEMGDAGEWFSHKKLDCVFGRDLTHAAIGWSNSMENAQSDRDFAETLPAGLAFQNEWNGALARRRERAEAGFSPEYFWLNEALPGFIVQQVGLEKQPHLFVDWRHFRQIAAETTGDEDDFFTETCLRAWPTDSIESFFPVWKMPTSADSACSNLGAGFHLKFLGNLNVAFDRCPNFSGELARLKDLVLEDIVDKNACFWQPRDLVVAELRQILAAELPCILEADRTALASQLSILENGNVRSLRVNVRSGE